MKNILFALVGVLLGFLLCYFLKPESDNSKQLPFLSDKEMEEKQMIIDELKEAYMTKDYDSTDGIFIKKSDRIKKLNAFKIWKNKVGNVDQTIITDHFFIGKDKLYQLVNEMKLENSRNSGKDKIGGLIIELGITDKTTYRDSNGNPTRVINGNRLEIMIFPTKVNKGSIMRDKSSESDSLMVQGGPTLLDDTMPCPDNCNQMIKEVSVIVREVSFYSVLPGLLLGFLHLKRKRLPQTYRPTFFLLLLSITCDILARWAAREYQNNMPVSQFYSFGQAFLLFLFFSLAIPHAKKPLLILGLVYITYYILNSIFFEPILTFNSNARIVQTLIFIPLCLYFFYSVYVHETIFQIEKSGVFWIVIGILIYYSGSFFTFLLSHKILQVPDNTFFGTWIVHNISNLLRNSCFFIGFLMSRHHE